MLFDARPLFNVDGYFYEGLVQPIPDLTGLSEAGIGVPQYTWNVHDVISFRPCGRIGDVFRKVSAAISHGQSVRTYSIYGIGPSASDCLYLLHPVGRVCITQLHRKSRLMTYRHLRRRIPVVWNEAKRSKMHFRLLHTVLCEQGLLSAVLRIILC